LTHFNVRRRLGWRYAPTIVQGRRTFKCTGQIRVMVNGGQVVNAIGAGDTCSGAMLAALADGYGKCVCVCVCVRACVRACLCACVHA
jgi:sugar/nucleoside kinase (ribokinase family)